MRLKQYINEKYWERISKYGNSAEIFVNPSWKELMEISDAGSDYIRFSAYHNKKKVFVWNAESILHDDVESETGEPHMDGNTNLLACIAKKKGNMFIAVDSDQLENLFDGYDKDFLKKILSKDWSWLKKYKIDVSKIIKEFQEDLKNL